MKLDGKLHDNLPYPEQGENLQRPIRLSSFYYYRHLGCQLSAEVWQNHIERLQQSKSSGKRLEVFQAIKVGIWSVFCICRYRCETIIMNGV